MVRIGVIGYGYWGPNLVRNFADASGAQVVAVSDLNEDRLALISQRYPGVFCTSDSDELINSSDVDAVVVATPVNTHYDLAMAALKAGKHVLVEKPLASSSEQSQRLIDEAEKRNLVLMVDHTFVYTGAVRKIEELLDSGKLGRLYYYDSVRVNLGLFQHDVNVLWDLAVHDLSIMDYLIGEEPQAVSATGMAHVEGQPEDVAYLTCYFSNQMIAHFHVNWLSPVKIRQTLIGCDKQMIVFDDLEPSEKIKIYDKGITLQQKPEQVYQMLVGYRAGDMWAPQLDGKEALAVEASHFVECIEKSETPLTDGRAGLRVVRILEAASASMNKNGEPVTLG